MFAIYASSLTSGIGADVREGLRADLVVTSATTDFPTIDPTLAGRIAALPDVDAVAALSTAEGIVAGNAETIGGIDPTALPTMFDLDPIAGDLAGLSEGGVAVVGDDPTLLGGTLAIEFEQATLQAPIVAVVARSTGGFEAPLYYVDRAKLDALAGRLLDALLFVDLADGVVADASARREGAGPSHARVVLRDPSRTHRRQRERNSRVPELRRRDAPPRELRRAPRSRQHHGARDQ